MTTTKAKIDGSPFGAFAILQDGKWHSKSELVEKCGQEALRRVRTLRSEPYGSWDIEVTGGANLPTPSKSTDTWYRLPKQAVINNALAAAKLRARIVPFPAGEIHDVDKPLAITLSVSDGVLILANMVGSQQLKHPDIQHMWQQTRAEVMHKLQEALPADIVDPFDLVEPDTQGD